MDSDHDDTTPPPADDKTGAEAGGDRGSHEVRSWLAGRLPAEWFAEPPRVRMDKDEILIVGTLAGGTNEGEPAEATIVAFRESTRKQRMQIADHAQAIWNRTVSWGVGCDDVEIRFTTASVPVMTRLRIDERQVLDTLIDAGVARSRSEALAWCVQQVGRNQGEWIGRLKQAMSEVERIRREGPA